MITRLGSALALAAFLSGCGQPTSSPVSSPVPTTTQSQRSGTGDREQQVAFLNQIRSADPDGRTIDRALLNEQNELGLILDRSVELSKIPALMKLMLTKMAAQFPGQDVTIIAYTPSSPPRKVGTALLNALTRDMTYTAEP